MSQKYVFIFYRTYYVLCVCEYIMSHDARVSWCIAAYLYTMLCLFYNQGDRSCGRSVSVSMAEVEEAQPDSHEEGMLTSTVIIP